MYDWLALILLDVHAIWPDHAHTRTHTEKQTCVPAICSCTSHLYITHVCMIYSAHTHII
jgi:hypothetical protein